MLVQMLWRNYLYIRTHRSESSLVLAEPYGRQDYGVLVVHKNSMAEARSLGPNWVMESLRDVLMNAEVYLKLTMELQMLLNLSC